MLEIKSAFAIKFRTGAVKRLQAILLSEVLDRDVLSARLEVVALGDSDYKLAELLLGRYAFDWRLRTLDALQLAVALNFREHSHLDYFVAADKALCEVALLERFAVINPEYP